MCIKWQEKEKKSTQRVFWRTKKTAMEGREDNVAKRLEKDTYLATVF